MKRSRCGLMVRQCIHTGVDLVSFWLRSILRVIKSTHAVEVLTSCQNTFTDNTLNSKFAIKWLLEIEPHLERFDTLLCEILMYEKPSRVLKLEFMAVCHICVCIQPLQLSWNTKATKFMSQCFPIRLTLRSVSYSSNYIVFGYSRLLHRAAISY